jgi:hypothetical protein
VPESRAASPSRLRGSPDGKRGPCLLPFPIRQSRPAARSAGQKWRPCSCRIPRSHDKLEPTRGEAITTAAWRVLIVGAEGNRDVVKDAVGHWTQETVCCSSVSEARAILSDAGFSLIFCEEQFADGTYQDLLPGAAKSPKARFIVMSATPELDEKYDQAIQLGAFDVIASPCRKCDIQWMAIRALQDEGRRGGSRRRAKSDAADLDDPSEGDHHAGKEASEGRR